MFEVKGDVIEYEGKPVGFLTLPIGGLRMTVVDAFNNYEDFIADHVDAAVREQLADDKRAVLDVIERAQDDIWMPEEWAEWLKSAIKTGLEPHK